MNGVSRHRALQFTCASFCIAFGWAWAAPFERELGLPTEYTNERVTKLAPIAPGETVTLLDMEGPGAVTHLWMTVGKCVPRHIVVRMYWDDETDPSVEAPLTDFFGVGHNHAEPELYFATPCLSVAPKNGYNLYLPMPFRKRARITVTNDQEAPLTEGGGLYFQADILNFTQLSEDTPYLHAQWRRESPAQRRGKPYTVIDAAGKGFVAGLTLHVRDSDVTDRWYHGGGDTIYIDGPASPALLKGIGGEDFFGQSWASHLFSSPYAGCTNIKNNEISLYRFFLEGPPRFSHSIRVAFGALENEVTSVGYWYQSEPHHAFFELPGPDERLPHQALNTEKYSVEVLPDDQIPLAVIGPFAGPIDAPNPLDGIFPVKLDTGMLTNYPLPFKNTIPTNENRRVSWESAQTHLSWIDLEAIYKPKMPGIRLVQALPRTLAYVLIRVQSDTAQDATLRIGHDDPLRVWLNGKPVGNFDETRGFVLENAALKLDNGANEVLLKVANEWNGNWAAFAASLSFEAEAPLHFDSFDALSPAFEPR